MSAATAASFGLNPGRVVIHRQNGTADRLAHNAPMNAELRGNTRDRVDPKFMLPMKPLEQIHFGSPVHAKFPVQSGQPWVEGPGVGQNSPALLGRIR
ncbi:hypothetical protein [Rhodopila sp.]|uniref:hypothetical protein n=1 Tax=Rhodopila sp. TaxID=2480087 RepID=UPI003D0C3180